MKEKATENEQSSPPGKLVVENLYKIFGAKPDRAIELLDTGRSKDEIRRDTGLTIGVQDASFNVRDGEIFVVMGLSGSGKSTLVRMLNRLIEPTRGRILIDGEDVTDCSEQALRDIRLRKMAMVFQHFALFPHMTVAQNAAYGLKIQGVKPGERRRHAVRALKQVGLDAWADSPPTSLSGGMQQRVGLARSLAVDPEILLMDEPFSALDPLIRRDMQKELLELQRTLHKTIVFITHDLNEALMLGDRIAIMKEGRFVQVGTPQDIVSEPADEYVAAFTRDIDRSRVFTAADVMRAPEALSIREDDAGSACRRMESLNRNGLYVLDGDEVAGVVTYRDAIRSAHDDDALHHLMRTDYPRIDADRQLFETYPACRGGLPVAVIGDGDTLAGVVDPLDVFDHLVPDVHFVDDGGAAPQEARA